MITIAPTSQMAERRKKIYFSIAIVACIALLFIMQSASASHNINITPDQDGPDDVPAQTDVTLLGFDDSHLPDYYVAQMQFDDTAYPGGNSGDGCIFFDSDDSGGFSDFAVCGSFIQNTTTGMVELQSAALYDCKGSEPNNDEGKRCGFIGGGGDGSNGIIAQDLDGDGIFESDGNGDPLTTPYDTTCSLNTSAADPFDGVGTHNTSGEQDPILDTQLTCQIYADELVELDGDVPTGIVVSNACSFTSPDPSSESKDCVVDAGSGFLVIVKNTTGGDDAFDFNVDGSLFATLTTVGGSASTDSLAVPGGSSLSLVEVITAGWQLDSATCDNGDAPDALTVGAAQTVTCTFNNSLALVAPDITLVKTANPTQVNEPGGNVVFTVDITNNGDAGTIDSLVDDIHGDLATSCVDGSSQPLVGQTIDAGETLSCSFSATVNGNAGYSETDTVTTVITNGAGSDTASDTATVTVEDVASSIEIIKTADPIQVSEPGGDVTFSFVINNLSAVDSVDITSLNDTIYGDLNGLGTCSVPQTLGVGGSYSCEFTANVSGDPGYVENNVVTASGTDDDGNPVSDDDEATVTVIDVPSVISVVKTADPTTVNEPGDDVTFTFVVNNDSLIDEVTISSLADTIYGDLNGQGDCAVPQTIAAGGSYSCSITEFVGGSGGDSHQNTVTASGTDDDGNPVDGSDDETVEINDTPSSIEIVKTASPENVPEPGGDVTFSFVVNNTSAADEVTINSLIDSIYGNLVLVLGSTCAVPQTIAAGGSYSCEFTATVTGNAGDTETNVVTATGVDDDGNPVTDDDDAIVTITDVPASIEILKSADPTSVPETGANVTYTFVINNLSAVDSVTITTLDDSIYGDLNGMGDCSAPQTIAAGGSYTCSITEFVSGDAGEVITNVATASGTDDDGNPVSDDDDADVTVTDVAGSIELVKAATPTSVDEPGDNVVFSFTINNTSAVDEVTITSLTDTIYGDLNGQGDCSVPQTISVGGSYTCSITEFVGGDAGDMHTNVATASGTDADGQPVSDSDDAKVDINDVPSAIEIIKTADPTSVSEPGGNVEFSFVVNNLSSADEVTIDSLIDTIYGDLDGQGDCFVPQTIPPNGSYSCSFVAFVSGNAGEVETNVVTASGTDDDGNPVSDNDDANVTINDLPSSIILTKSANPTTVDEPGGDVTFSFVVDNTSAADAVTIDSLTDSIYGDLNGQGDCSVPQTIAAGDSYSCAFTVFVAGNAGDVETNVATASGTDDDGNPVSDDDDAMVTLNNVQSTIEVVKIANPSSVSEPGGDVTFSIQVINQSTVDAVTIDTLNDSIYNDLNGQGSCSVPQTIPASGSYSCEFTATVNGNAGDNHTNVVTASGLDEDGDPVSDDDDATVTVDDVPSSVEIIKTADPMTVDEPGGDVTFNFVVNNTSLVDVITINSLIDSIYGDLNGQGDCAVPQTLAAGDSYSCAFTAFVGGNAGDTETNVVTVSGTDDDGQPVSDDDNATVTINDLQSSIEVIKTADPVTVDEPGGDVTFSFNVENTSVADTVTINSLIDTVYGNLDGQGDCTTGAVLAPGESYSCSITAFIAGNAGDSHTNVVTVSGTDDDGANVSDDDDAAVNVADVPSSINMTKTPSVASVDEPGGDVTFTFLVENTSAVDDVTINSLTDTIYGDLNGQGDCAVPQTLAPGESYTCSITEFVGGNANDVHTNTATAAGVDDDGNPVSEEDDAEVTITDVPSSINMTKVASPGSIDEPGGDVTFTFTVENTSAVDDVTIDSLTDSIYGDLTLIPSSTCTVPQILAPGESYDCSITVFVGGNAFDTHMNVATAAGTDDDGIPVTDDDDETVEITDVPSSIKTTKSANPSSVPETGGDVTFTVVVENTSLVDDVTINSVIDDVFGDVSASCVPALPVTLTPGETVTCTFIEFVSGNAGTSHVNVATAAGEDDDGMPVEDDDDAEVPFEDVLPDITVVKTADPASIPETGADVTFTFEVTNNSLEDATLDSLVDSDFGDLNGQGTCSVPQALAGNGGTYSCAITVFLSGDASGAAHNNVVTATASDDDGNTTEDDDDETVPYEDVLPDITVVKTADPISVPETGGNVLFTFEVTNNSLEDATLDSMVDTVYGDLDGQGDCSFPQPLAGNGGTYSCSFVAYLSGDASGLDHNNVVTATASDDDGNSAQDDDDATVTYEDVLPDLSIVKTANPTSVSEPGGDVIFSIVVTNNSLEDVTIDALTDSDFNLVTRCPDAVGTVLANGASYTCTFSELISGNVGEDHQNTATVTGSDNDGNSDTESDDADVTIEDVVPVLDIVKSGSASINEGGDTANYTIEITNNSVPTDPVTVTSLIDDQFGDLLPEAEAANGGNPIVLQPGDSFSFSFDRPLTLNAGEQHVNVATVCGDDDEGTEGCDNDDHTVDVDPVDPILAIVKSGPASINEGGDTATYTIEITNNSVSTDPVTLTSLTDDQFGNLLPEAEAANGGNPIVLQSGDSFSFSFDRVLTLDVGEQHVNVAEVCGDDDEGTEACDDDDHTVDVDPVDPVLTIDKSGPALIDEGGDVATYTIEITNDSVSTDPMTITSLNDDRFGDLLPEAEAANGGNPIVLQSGDSFSFSFDRPLTLNAGEQHVNVATVCGDDDEGTEDCDDDDHTVEGDPVDPIIAVDKTASQDQVFAPGEDVTFTLVVDNNSVSTDPVTISNLVDSIHGDLNGQGTCSVPQTIQPGDSYSCSFTVFVDGDETNVITADGTDDEGTPVSDSDDATVEMVNPAITIEKNTGPADADTAPGPEILAGETVNWFYQVTNIGDVPLSNLSVFDDQGVSVICPTDTLAAGASTVCEGNGIATVGQYANLGTASASYTDPDGDVAVREDSDPSHYFGATPSVDIVKTFADDSVIAGGAGSSFTLVVTNDGNVHLDDVGVSDLVDSRMVVNSVSSTDADCSASSGQTVNCNIASLDVGESATITVDFAVDAATRESLDTPNTATATDNYTDDIGNSVTIDDSDTDTIDILIDIELNIVKTFDPTAVPQGTNQSFTLEVTNSGPSDAVDVSVTDVVDSSIAVSGVSVTSGSGDCSASSGQNVDCTVHIPVGESVTITVDYVTAPFLQAPSPYGTQSGDDFRFVFVNGSVLEGSTDGGPVYLDGVDITADVTVIPSLTKNDIVFDPPGSDPAFELHLSCSDPFTGGWGQSGGPVEGVDSNWQISFFSVTRYQNGDFRKACGNVVNEYDVDNTATTTGEDSFGTETDSDTATLTIEPGIKLDRIQTNGKRMTVRLTNFTGEDKEIAQVDLLWPSSNGNLTKIRLDDTTTWAGNESPSSTVLDPGSSGWNGGTLMMGEAILRFDFKSKVNKTGYTVRITFTDGTFLDIVK